MSRPIATCDECASDYYADASPMDALCPECAHLLYGYPGCDHVLVDGRCARCRWNGATSPYLRSRTDKGEPPPPPAPRLPPGADHPPDSSDT